MINYATPAGTKAYTERFPDLTYRELGRTGWWVSQAGFGCYRVDVRVPEHQAALKKALRAGINLIDTSANYADGRSEELVGAVLADGVRTGEIDRAGIVVVSKVGYLQGQNYQLSQECKREGRPFPDLVLYADGLEHCIHPEFLADQLTRSLERLQMQTLDCYLLHNPEYYLGYAHKQGIPLEEAREEYYRRIELAFCHLEQEVANGRIRCYGISSNTFPAVASDPQFSSLERIYALAESISPEHHFRVLQLPMNLQETGGVTEANQSNGQSVIEWAEAKRLGVLINRPLNALAGQGINRLADLPMPSPYQIEQMQTLVHELLEEEAILQQTLLPHSGATQEEQAELADKLSAGALLQAHGRRFTSLEHWQEVLQQFLIPTVQSGVQSLLHNQRLTEDAAAWVETYVDLVNKALQAHTAFYQQKAAESKQAIRAQAAQADADWATADTLSRLAIRALRSTAGITSVLVGMRRDAYVDDVLAELKQPVPSKTRTASWAQLRK